MKLYLFHLFSKTTLRNVLSSVRNFSTAKDGFLTIGNVSLPIKRGKCPHLVPSLYGPADVPQSILSHIKWMMQKDLLKQDVYLIGPPGPLRRNIVMMYLEMTGKEFEYMALSRDTTECDLKQRRELTGGTAIYVDQCAVRAALQGRVLILEGIEKAERNVLPVLNNLLENREMQLDDGRFLISAERFDKLLQLHSPEHLHSMKIVRVHPDFRVIALGLPVPHYSGNPLDPPFRSRFQGRDVGHLLLQDQLKILDFSDEAAHCTKMSKLISLGLALKTQEAKQLNLPDFPLDNLASVAAILNRVHWVNTSKMIERLYPHHLFSSEAKAPVIDLMKTFGLDNESMVTSRLESIEHSSSKPCHANVRMQIGSKVTNFEVPSGSLIPTSLISSNFISTSFHDDLISELFISHSTGDFCIVGPRGCGKSALTAKFAELLGYELENIMLYQDMTPRDFLQQRTMDTSGDSGWRQSSLVDAALEGKLAVLDGLHRVHPGTLSVLHRLIHDRELDLFDGARLLKHDRYDFLKKENSWSEEQMRERNLWRIHPSFRIVGLSEPPSIKGPSSSNWLTSELLTVFLYHPMRHMTPQEEVEIVRHLVPNYSRMELVLKFAQLLRTSPNNQLNSLSSSMSTRQLVRTAKRLASFPDDDVHHLLNKACLSRFLPNVVRDAFKEELKNLGIAATSAPDREKTLKCEVKDGRLRIGEIEAVVYKSDEVARVPDILFYDNPQHLSVMEDMLKDYLLGEHLLLIGNQGVGKNKIVDRFLNLLNRPREYIQLHRDTTVQTLTIQTAVRGGVVEYEDSPLVKAVKMGRILVIDEADKAPTNVTCILKCLIESGLMHLPDGRKIVPANSNTLESSKIIKMHPDFRMIVLANRPGFPFLGNDFFGTMGEAFGTHVVDNPDTDSELSMLRKYAPSVDQSILKRIVAIFGDLREMADKGEVSYPFSTREAVSIVKHLQMFPKDGLARVVENVFDFDAYDVDLRKVIMETMQKHGIAVGINPSSTKLSKELSLPAFKFQSSLEITKVECNLQPKQNALTIEDMPKLKVCKGKVSSFDRRSLSFGEERSAIHIPLPEGSLVTRAAVTYGKGRQTFEEFGDDVLHVLATHPSVLYSVNVAENVLSSIDLGRLFTIGSQALKLDIAALDSPLNGSVLVHQENSTFFYLVDTKSGCVKKVTSAVHANKIFDLIFKNSSKADGTYKLLCTENTSCKRVVFFRKGSKHMEMFDLTNNVSLLYTLPFSVGDIFLVAPHDYVIIDNAFERMYLLKKNGEYQLKSFKKDTANVHSVLPYAEFPIDSSLHLTKLNHQKINKPARIVSTKSSFASFVVGKPNCTLFEVYQSRRADLNSSYISSPTEIAWLPGNGILVRVVASGNVIPNIIWGADVKDAIGFLEVVDVMNKSLKYIPIPGFPGETHMQKWQFENQCAMNKSSKHPNPNNILVTHLADDSLCTVDKMGIVRNWEIVPSRLSESLKKWQMMIGDGERSLQVTYEKELNKIPLENPKHGTIDPTGAPHVGGSTFAGGTGGMGTAGLGGVGGPYRLDGGGDVYQVSDKDKANVPPEVLQAARHMALKAWKERLKEINMSEHSGEVYERFILPVRPHVKHLKNVLDTLQAKSKERQWLRHQTHGDVDEGKLIEGVIGERGVYKRRGEREPEAGSFQEKPKHMRLVCDASGSMYRFNGYDGRMDRQVESMLMVMEAFQGYEHKIVYDIFAHSGEGPSFPFVASTDKSADGVTLPKNEKQRLDVALSLIAHSQFCMSGDHTLEATKFAIDSTSKVENVDEKFVIILSDANIGRYGIGASRFGELLMSDPSVNAFVIFVGSLGDQAQRLLTHMPPGHSFICKDSKQLPNIMNQIFLSSFLL